MNSHELDEYIAKQKAESDARFKKTNRIIICAIIGLSIAFLICAYGFVHSLGQIIDAAVK